MLKPPFSTPIRTALRSQLNPRGRGAVIVRAGVLATRWRVLWVKKLNTYAWGLAELDLGGNATTGGTAIANPNPQFASAAFDGDPATLWGTTFDFGSFWVGYQFPEPVSVPYITVKAHTTANYFPQSFDVEYSNDGVTWEVAWSWLDVSPVLTPSELRTFDSDDIADANVVAQIAGAVFLKHPPGGSVSYIAGAVFTKRLENNVSWRILWDAVDGGNAYAAIGEVEFRSTVGGADQATGGGAQSSGVYSSSTTYQASNAFDGTNTTRWIGVNNEGVGSWIGYAFPAPMASFAEVALTMKNDSAIGGPAAFRVQRYESFAAGWVTVLTRTGEAAWAAGETRTYAIV